MNGDCASEVWEIRLTLGHCIIGWSFKICVCDKFVIYFVCAGQVGLKVYHGGKLSYLQKYCGTLVAVVIL